MNIVCGNSKSFAGLHTLEIGGGVTLGPKMSKYKKIKRCFFCFFPDLIVVRTGSKKKKDEEGVPKGKASDGQRPE